MLARIQDNCGTNAEIGYREFVSLSAFNIAKCLLTFKLKNDQTMKQVISIGRRSLRCQLVGFATIFNHFFLDRDGHAAIL